ncbi:sulfate transporter family-domain-containing protein [Spinellus fusiger]|nr:sulfate transporter family-domain-containing protein [Spinellus fusiger]
MTTFYLDQQPTPVKKWLANTVSSLPCGCVDYLRHLFPIVEWLPRYNWTWLWGDLICAITVGTIVVPQSMAYAKIAGLPAEYGLYSSFVGVMIYPFLGTSKDISIGTTAIMSLLVGQIVFDVINTPQYLQGLWTLKDVAVVLALFSGIITFCIGIFRLGILFHFISQPAIAGFMSGSGMTILINQLNKLLGIPGIITTEVPYLVFGKTLQGLPHATVDAAFGIISFAWLYSIKYACIYLSKHYAHHKNKIFFLSISRNIVVIVVSTLISYLVNHFGNYEKSPFTILGPVPPGFQNMGVPKVDHSLLSYVITYMPGVVVLLIMEHCAISSSLGKTSDYRIDVNQESIAIGLTNILASFFSAYPSTGAFSRTAVMSKSGCRTPLSNLFVGLIVVLAIYALTPVFQYIPTAALAAVIMNAIPDLLTGPAGWIKLWNIHPSEFLVFASAYVISLCTRIDISVYVPVGLSLIVQLYRVARPSYAILGCIELPLSEPEKTQLQFHPLDHPTLGTFVRPLGEGIICFQPQENIVFQNAAYIFDRLADEIKHTTRPGIPPSNNKSDMSWNISHQQKSMLQPVLGAIVLDLSGVHHMDATGIEQLVSIGMMVDRYSGTGVHWFIVVQAPNVRKSLLLAGFGRQCRVPGFSHFMPDNITNASGKKGHPIGGHGCTLSVVPDTHLPPTSHSIKEGQTYSTGDINNVEKGYPDTTGPSEAQISSPTAKSEQELCYCETAIDTLPERMTSIQDKYQYFFLSLYEASQAAVMYSKRDRAA